MRSSVRVEKYKGKNNPFIRLVVEDGRGGKVSALLSWAQAVRLIRDLANALASETVLVKYRELDRQGGGWRGGRGSGAVGSRSRPSGEKRKGGNGGDSVREL